MREGKEEGDEESSQQETRVETWMGAIYIYENRFRFCVFHSKALEKKISHFHNLLLELWGDIGDYEYWSRVWLLERYHNKRIRNACMNVEGDEPHVYLLEISDRRWELDRNQRNGEYVYFTSWKVCVLDNIWSSCRTLTTTNMDRI